MLGFARGSRWRLHLAELAPVEVTEAAVLTLVRKGVGALPVPPSSLASDALLAVGWGSDPPSQCCPVRQQDCWYFSTASAVQIKDCWYFSTVSAVQTARLLVF